MATLTHPPVRAPTGRARTGLTTLEATRRRVEEGPNAIESKRESPLRKFLSFFWGPIPWMIEIAAVLSAFAQHWEDLAIIGLMLSLNAVVGFWEEFKADDAIDALKVKLALKARVLRDGVWHEVDAAELVPDDVVLVRLGNIVPADVELFGDGFLSVDQSALTGESLPVEKKHGDAAYSGSVVRLGEMRGRVTATGMKTYFGRTAKLVETAEPQSHFQKAVLRIGNVLILLTLALVALILLVALFRHSPFIQTILFVLILTVAAIPVALPAVLSVTMAAGASRLARMRAIVSRLASIEEMAGMDVLFSDKTGTLTKNELTAGKSVVIGARDEQELLWAAASTSREGGDAIDIAILSAAAKAHADITDYEVIRFVPFDPVHKRAEAEVETHGSRSVMTKGAPQVILDLAKPDPTSLVVGKPVGVITLCWLAERTRLGTRPADLSWSVIAAASVLTGIGFTMSIFIAGLAFDSATLDAAKVGILSAFLLSGSVGLVLLFFLTKRRRHGLVVAVGHGPVDE